MNIQSLECLIFILYDEITATKCRLIKKVLTAVIENIDKAECFLYG